MALNTNFINSITTITLGENGLVIALKGCYKAGDLKR